MAAVRTAWRSRGRRAGNPAYRAALRCVVLRRHISSMDFSLGCAIMDGQKKQKGESRPPARKSGLREVQTPLAGPDFMKSGPAYLRTDCRRRLCLLDQHPKHSPGNGRCVQKFHSFYLGLRIVPDRSGLGFGQVDLADKAETNAALCRLLAVDRLGQICYCVRILSCCKC